MMQASRTKPINTMTQKYFVKYIVEAVVANFQINEVGCRVSVIQFLAARLTLFGI